jgi:hypothetical protein
VAAARNAAGGGGALLLDFMFPSPITAHDENYWDQWHYRVGIAERIVADIGAAMHGRATDDDRILAAPAIDP